MNIHRLAPALFVVFAACTEEPIDLTDTRDTTPEDTALSDTNLEDTAPEDTRDEDLEGTNPEDTNLEDTSTDASDFVAHGSCPTAIITSTSEDIVVPTGTTVVLDGTQSHGNGVSVVEYHWDLDGPSGSPASFIPSASHATPSLHLEVPGVYTIRLDVVDELGARSCVPAIYRFFVEPTENEFFAVLSWTTPGVADEDGADLDLHLMHPLARGRDLDGDGVGDGFCDHVFDAHWFNPRPNWGFIDPAIPDNPEIEDGTRPNEVETATLPLLEEGVYFLGIHAYDGRDSNSNVVSYATLRIYRAGVLTLELADIELTSGNFWKAVAFDRRSTDPIHTCPDAKTACITDAHCGGERCGLQIYPRVNY